MDKNFIKTILEAILGLLAASAPKKTEAPKPVPAPTPVPVEKDSPDIDWTDPKAKITSRFSVGEALTLQSWGVMHVPTDDEKTAIMSICYGVGKAAELLEQKLGHKVYISVHAFMRPAAANIPGSEWDGQDYNKYIYWTQVWKALTEEEKALKKVPKSPHRTGRAIDFHVVGYEGAEKCMEIRKLLAPHLEELGLRMENIKGSWIHLDNMPVGPSGRWFSIS